MLIKNISLTNIFEEIISSITERCTEVVALSKDVKFFIFNFFYFYL